MLKILTMIVIETIYSQQTCRSGLLKNHTIFLYKYTRFQKISQKLEYILGFFFVFRHCYHHQSCFGDIHMPRGQPRVEGGLTK